MSLLLIIMMMKRLIRIPKSIGISSIAQPFKVILMTSIMMSILFLAPACQRGKHIDAPDVSHIDLKFQLIRYDSILYTLDTMDVISSLSGFHQVHKAFSNIYYRRILHFEHNYETDSQAFSDELKALIRADEWQSLNDTVFYIYPNLNQVKTELEQAFKYYQYYFPKRQAPDIYSCISEFGTATFLFSRNNRSDGLGISLDMFMGEQFDYTVLSSLSGTFAAFNARTLNRAHLTKKVMDVIIDDLFPPTNKLRMLDVIVDEGKKQYLRDLFLPYHPDTVKWEYSDEQMQWVKDNEWNIYTFIISNDLLYSTNVNKYLRLVKPAPHSMDMPPEAPGRAVNYIGYLIVKSFIERNPQISLDEMLAINDGQYFLEKGKYKPKK